jgi:ribosomal protein S18 acetylase RimI-like enzyme
VTDDVAARARAWRHAAHAAVCDVVEPWAHGTVVRTTKYPSYFDFNVVRVEDDPGMSVDALAAFADEALAGLAHRRLDFELAEAAAPLRADFEVKGFKTVRLVCMRHEAPPPAAPDVAVEEVPYDAVHDLRVAWYSGDSPEHDPSAYLVQARAVASTRDVRVLAVREAGAVVAFAQLERDGDAAEITQVYVDPHHRGAGRGTAMTRAAIEAAGSVRDLWILADDEDRPKDLYARLGFRPAWTAFEFTLWPDASSGP